MATIEKPLRFKDKIKDTQKRLEAIWLREYERNGRKIKIWS